MGEPIRQCKVCRRRLPKSELTRWVRHDSSWCQDPSQHRSGRGYYTCSDECAAKLQQSQPKPKPDKV